MAAEYDVVDVFVGNFDSKKALNQYLKEVDDETDQDLPISRFAKDLGQSYYDHDLLESTFRKSAKSWAKLCEGLSFRESWLEAARSAYQAVSATAPNTVILVFGEAIEQPASVSGAGYELHYLGRFRCSSVESTPSGDGPPAVCYLELSDRLAVVNGEPVSLVPIEAAGATIGHAGAVTDGVYIDLPHTERPIAPLQVRIYPDQFGQWIIEDLAGGDVSVYRGQTLNQSKAMPWHEIGFKIGGVPFVWLAWKR